MSRVPRMLVAGALVALVAAAAGYGHDGVTDVLLDDAP